MYMYMWDGVLTMKIGAVVHFNIGHIMVVLQHQVKLSECISSIFFNSASVWNHLHVHVCHNGYVMKGVAISLSQPKKGQRMLNKSHT